MGKTLCYNLPVLNAVRENPDTRALYLFPTKAHAQDQLAELQDLAKRLEDGFGVFTYEGDTPSDARRAIRERGHIVPTNLDMLHTGILPHHTKWMRLLENLRYLVLDELHTYRGVFARAHHWASRATSALHFPWQRAHKPFRPEDGPKALHWRMTIPNATIYANP